MIDNEREVLIGNLLKTQSVGDVSKKYKGIVSMPSNQPVTEAAKLMVEYQVGSIIIKNTDKMNAEVVEVALNALLEHLENNCPEFENEKFDSQKIENLVEQYMTDLS